ncbi:hypothetical protein CIG75_06465 [Tumebacillus algifaecis]|uniref:Uncharacterized protein n=1 Tax=Tumebacillus algifaecis TaxID=1214604 RepID=A0A223CZ75_9BACL|nr:hypothetical protein [Tumebacillus algifaecis]ASS74648.1 hypothetical protein CIG75_06465 [Tumebacillus algifaecis]
MKKLVTCILALSLAAVPTVSAVAAETGSSNRASALIVAPEGSGSTNLGLLGGTQAQVNGSALNVSYGGSVTVSFGNVLDRFDHYTTWSFKVWLYNQTTGQSTVIKQVNSGGLDSTTFSDLHSGDYQVYVQNSTSKLLFFDVSYSWL